MRLDSGFYNQQVGLRLLNDLRRATQAEDGAGCEAAFMLGDLKADAAGRYFFVTATTTGRLAARVNHR